MQVDESTKNKYRSGSGENALRLYFPDLDLTIPMESIVTESMHLSESLSDSESIEFIGCISSQISIQVYNIREELKNQKIEVYISSGDTTEIPLFTGIVESVPMAANRNYKTINAFDVLYTKGNTDIADWYKSLTFPLTIKQFRDSLFTYLGIEQVVTSLPNDEILIEKQYSPTTMQALPVIKSICQINGVFGIINRYGLFEYRILPKTEATEPTENIEFYKRVDYQEYTVKPVDKLTIRQNDSDEGVSYGSGENNYIIQGNMFTLNLEEETLQQMAENIYPNVEGFYYYPFESDNNGLPWIEVGKDIVSYEVYDFEHSSPGNTVYKNMSFYILSRTLTGINALRDSYSAEGDEYQRVFITDVETQVETIITQVQQMIGTLEDYSLHYVYFTNTEKVVVGDGDEVTVSFTRFNVIKPTQVMINMEYLLDVETTNDGINFNDLKLTAKYYYDNQLIDTRQPRETFVDGEHILRLFYPLNVTNVLMHDWEVRLSASGGTATINLAQALNIMSGQGLVESDWSGKFVFKQKIGIIPIADNFTPITMKGITDRVGVSQRIPETIGLSEEIPIMPITGTIPPITMIGITDSVNISANEIGG